MMPWTRRSQESRARLEARLREGARAALGSVTPQSTQRILAAVERGGASAHSPRRAFDAMQPSARRRMRFAVAAAAGLLVGWIAWTALREEPERGPVAQSETVSVRDVLQVLPPASMASALDRPLLAEADHMRADAVRAFDFLLARAMPLTTRASRR